MTEETNHRMIQFEKDGNEFWLDIVDGKFDFGGNIEPSESAKIFLKELSELITNRMLENAKIKYKIEEEVTE